MAHVQRRSRFDDSPVSAKSISKEALEVLRLHPVALNLELPHRCSPRNLLRARRISEHQVGDIATHEPLDISLHGGVAAEHAMFAQDPKVTRPPSTGCSGASGAASSSVKLG